MSTRIDLSDDDVAIIEAQIDVMSQEKPISTTITELQLVVERLSFSGLDERPVQNDRTTDTDIDLFFRDEVSEPMLDFIKWAASKNWLGVLSGEEGTALLNQVVAKYQRITEVQFTTAIALDKDHKRELTSRLRAVFPEPARILFATAGQISAGFTISTGQSRIADKSLRRFVAQAVPRTAQLDPRLGGTRRG